jgi:chemotaxis protein MotB
MARRRIRHEEHENHEAWAIPYADLLTLMLAFFVVMYAMSSVNEGKYRVLSNSLNAAFSGAPHSTQPIPVGPITMELSDQLPLSELNRRLAANLPARTLTPIPQTAHPDRESAPAPARADPQQQLDTIAREISVALAQQIHDRRVRVLRKGDLIEVAISTDILFGSGVAALAPAAITPLVRLADTLRPLPNAVRVEGYTDDRPISTLAYPSNWELSAARAASVVQLFTRHGVAPQRMAVIGYGEQRPTEPNTTSAGRSANRRVVVAILGPEATSGPAGN